MKTHLCILCFHLQEEYCWGWEGWKCSWIFLLLLLLGCGGFCWGGCFLMFEKSIISSNYFLWAAPWVILLFVCISPPPKTSFPGAFGRMETSHKDAIKQHLGDFAVQSFVTERTLTSSSFWDLPVVLLPGDFGNLPAAACAGFLQITHSVPCLRKNRKPNRRVL